MLAPGEEELDRTLRPQRLAEFVGQDGVKEQLEIFLAAARARNEPCEHVLLAGPPGLGKTSLAGIIAAEMGSALRVMSGPAVDRKADMASILTALEPSDVLFIDEIHRLNRAIEELLYPAMEDGCIDIVIGQGPGAHSIRLDLAPFTLVGATTRTGLLTTPLRDRFGITHRLDHYRPDEIELIVRRSARILDVEIDEAGCTRDRPALARHAADRQPHPAPRARLRPGAPRRRDRRTRWRWRRSTCSRSTAPAWSGSTARSCARVAEHLRGRPGRAVDAGGGDRRGAGHARGRLRALPAAAGPAPADAARPGRHARPAYAHLGLPAPGARPAPVLTDFAGWC